MKNAGAGNDEKIKEQLHQDEVDARTQELRDLEDQIEAKRKEAAGAGSESHQHFHFDKDDKKEDGGDTGTAKTKVKRGPFSMIMGSGVMVIAVIFLIIMVGWIFGGLGEDAMIAMDNYSNKSAQIDTLKQELKKKSWGDKVLAIVLGDRNNPQLEGLFIQKDNYDVVIVAPESAPVELRKNIPIISQWASAAGYDGIIFGRIYEDYKGLVQYSDFQGGTITDFEILTAAMEKMGGSKIVAFLSNPDRKNLARPYDLYVMGPMSIELVDERAGYVFWKTGKTYISIDGDNLSGKVSQHGGAKIKFKKASDLEQMFETKKSEPDISTGPLAPKDDNSLTKKAKDFFGITSKTQIL